MTHRRVQTTTEIQQGIVWNPSRRRDDSSVHEAVARFAAVEAAREITPARPAERSEPSDPTRRRVAFVAGCTGFLLVAVVAIALATGRSPAPGCEPITYALQGSPPAHARAELGAAISEIHRRTGLEFEEGAPAKPTLVVSWSDRGVTQPGPSPVVSDGATRAVGFGFGHWRSVAGGRVLANAVIEVDANTPWQLGLHRGDGLGAVFVHELGHVLGLGHSTEPTSFMHYRTFPQTPHWTAPELDELAQAGRQSGCRPTHIPT